MDLKLLLSGNDPVRDKEADKNDQAGKDKGGDISVHRSPVCFYLLVDISLHHYFPRDIVKGERRFPDNDFFVITETVEFILFLLHPDRGMRFCAGLFRGEKDVAGLVKKEDLVCSPQPVDTLLKMVELHHEPGQACECVFVVNRLHHGKGLFAEIVFKNLAEAKGPCLDSFFYSWFIKMRDHASVFSVRPEGGAVQHQSFIVQKAKGADLLFVGLLDAVEIIGMSHLAQLLCALQHLSNVGVL